MLKILYKCGAIDGNTFELKPSLYEGLDPMVAALDETVMSLQSGRLVTIGKNGCVELAEDGSALGVIVNDASGTPLFNKPALASGKISAMFGGGLIETDQVVEETVKPKDKLYCGTGENKGKWTKTAPSATSEVIGTAMSSNSATDKTVKIQSRV